MSGEEGSSILPSHWGASQLAPPQSSCSFKLLRSLIVPQPHGCVHGARPCSRRTAAAAAKFVAYKNATDGEKAGHAHQMMTLASEAETGARAGRSALPLP